MKFIENKIPPPLVALLCAAVAWGLQRLLPGASLAFAGQLPLALLCVLLGLALDLSGLWSFVRRKTTANPWTPERARSVVQSGPYRISRNPMYLGLALQLLGWCVYWGQPLGLLALALFVAFITRFQIIPEERALLQKFGAPYADYLRRVRRWI